MNYKALSGNIQGKIHAPSSKSALQRFIVAAALAKGVSVLRKVEHCKDSLACLSVIQNLGVEVREEKDALFVQGLGGEWKPRTSWFSVGESGLAVRMLTPIIALSDLPLRIEGEGSLLARPMTFFDEILPQLGVKILSNQGKLPLEIQGKIQPQDIHIDGSLSSQYLTGLLMLFPLAARDTRIFVQNLKSRPYIDLTLEVLKTFGIEIENEDYEVFSIRGNQRYKSCEAEIEGDWSGAAFALVAGAIAGEVEVGGLRRDSLQADKAILEVLAQTGAGIAWEGGRIRVKKPVSGLRPFHFDASDCPDLFPPLVALALYCAGESCISGANRLIHKESNRAVALSTEFSRLHPDCIRWEGDKIWVKGGLPLQGATCHSQADHRIAMALGVAALGISEGILIEEAEAINKSYPKFWEDLEVLRGG